MATRAAPKPISNSQAEKDWYLAATANEKAERAKFLVETRNLELDGRALRRAADVFDSRTIVFGSEVDEFNVDSAIDQLRDFRATGFGDITIVLNSPGGDVFDGLLLFDTVQALRNDGIKVTTVVRGLAASMGSILSQAGDKRVISRNSWLMIHEPSTIVWGKMGDIKREADMMVKMHKQLSAVLAERSHLTTADIIRKSKDKDWWMPADEAHAHGFFDEVV